MSAGGDMGGAVHASVWRNRPVPVLPRIEHDSECDTCVVGAGVAGLLIAERLASEGQHVVVLESRELIAGESGSTTGHVTAALDDRFSFLERLHGRAGASLAAESHAAAIRYIESLLSRLNEPAGWKRVDGYLTVNSDHATRESVLLEAECAAAARAGLQAELVTTLPPPWPAERGAICFPAQAQIDLVRLLLSVARRLQSLGVQIYAGSRVDDLDFSPRMSVKTAHGPVVRCKDAVMATNTPVNNRVGVHTKQAGYQTYVIALRVPAGMLPPLLWWDGPWENDPSYHYVRLLHGSTRDDGVDLLIVGGEDHKTGQGPGPDSPFQRLERWARARFPMCGRLEHYWSGEIMEPVDGLAYIGRNIGLHRHVHIVTGDSGNGITHGAIAAMIIPDLIMGRENPWTNLYDPGRHIGLRSLGDYASENANTFVQYRDWLRRGEAGDEAHIHPGEGAIVTRGLKQLAIYKDEHGQCTRLSAICPHLGGVVRWNHIEKTWDCPCHASRFDREGHVIHGPANSDLERLGTPEKAASSP